MTQTEREKAAYPTDRRGASAKQESSIQPSEYPVITQSAYIECVQRPASMVDRKMRSLCIGKSKLGNALLGVDKALHDYNPQVSKDGRDRKLYNKLRSVRRDLEKIQGKFPLMIK